MVTVPEIASITEGTATAGQVLTTATATDEDGDNVTFSIKASDDPNGYYAIDPTTGEVTLTAAGAALVNSGGDLPKLVVTATDDSPLGPLSGTGETTPAATTDVNGAPIAVDDGTAAAPAVTTGASTTVSGINVLANDSDPDSDPLTVTVASSPNGTVTIDAGGTLSFTPADGFVGDTTISYTISDGQGGTATAIVYVKVLPLPTIAAATGNVSEEGLPGGLIDALPDATRDTTNAVVASGTMAVNSVVTSVKFDAATAQPTTIGGTKVVWEGGGTQTLTAYLDANANGVKDATETTPVLTATINNSGSYTVTLNSAIKHPDVTVEDVVSVDLKVLADDAIASTAAASANLTIRIEDDRPTSGASLSASSSAPAQDTNLMLTLDISSSMGTESDASGNLFKALSASKDLVRFYDTLGTTKVLVTIFSDDAKVLGTVTGFTGSTANYTTQRWLTVNEAIAAIDKAFAAVSRAQTDYTDALNATLNAFNALGTASQATTGPVSGGKYVSFFMSDGDPNAQTGAPFTTAVNNWNSVVDSRNIDSFSLALGTAVSDPSYLNQIATNGTVEPADQSRNYLLVSNLNTLSDTLKMLATPPVKGNLMVSGTDTVTGQSVTVNAGADGLGSVFSIKIAGVEYRYDAASDASSVVGTAAPGSSFDNATNTWTVKFADGNTVAVNMSTGDYVYTVVAPAPAGGDVFEYTIQDTDGDRGSNTFKLTTGAGGETWIGTTGNDTHTGTAFADVLKGGGGADIIDGGPAMTSFTVAMATTP